MLSPPSVLTGSAKPSLRAAPLGVRNPLADDAIDVGSLAGLDLDEWQAEVLADAMALQPDGRWAAREVGIVVGRQNGKGSILEVRQLAGLFVLNDRLQVHSAHQFKTCYEHFRRVKFLVENCPLLRDQVDPRTGIRTGAGDQAIETKSGNRLRFIARSGSSGVGFSADVVYLDEAFKLDDSTMGDLLPTLSARPNPQIWYTSSAPHADSPVLHRLRSRALDGVDPRLFFVEWGNAPGADPLDPEAWARANPALGIRIGSDDIEAEQRSLAPSEFARERLGIPEPPLGEGGAIIPQWDDLGDVGSTIASHFAWALSVSPDRTAASFGLAGRTASGDLHVECVERRPGTDWVVAKAVEKWQKHQLPLRVHKSGPEAAFIAPLRERGVEVLEVSTAELAHATGQVRDAAGAGQLVHLGQSTLNKAVNAATLTTSRYGAETWDPRGSVDVSPLMAVTVAAGGVPAADDGDPQVWF